LRGIQNSLNELRAAGVEPVAISVDPPAQSKSLADKLGFTYPILSDRDAAIIRRYGVLHQGPETDGKPLARPAEFLVDQRGIVRWRNLTGDFRVRARPEQLLEAAKSLR
jgi:peroxiredoxin